MNYSEIARQTHDLIVKADDIKKELMKDKQKDVNYELRTLTLEIGELNHKVFNVMNAEEDMLDELNELDDDMLEDAVESSMLSTDIHNHLSLSVNLIKDYLAGRTYHRTKLQMVEQVLEFLKAAEVTAKCG